MIRTNDLTKRYGRTLAVAPMNLTIPSGVVVGLLGPNGAGKSTTFRMLAGTLAPTAGTAEIEGRDVVREARAARGLVGYLPESTPLYGEMRVREYLNFRATLCGLNRARRRRNVDLVVRRCWLRDVERKTIATLSKGYRQRVGLAAALVHEPPVLLLDEPTSGLDPSQILEMRTLVRELAGERTIVLSTHVLSEVEATCDRAIVIVGGRVQAEGTLAEIRAGTRPRYLIEAKSPAAEVPLRAVPGVRRVDAEALADGWTRLAVEATTAESDLREPIARALRDASVPVRELRREEASLETAFVRLASGEEPPRRAAAEPLPRSAEVTVS